MTGLLLLAAYPVLAVFRGVAILLLWGWFVIPALGAPVISLVDAIGLSIFIGLFTGRTPKKGEPPETGYWITFFLLSTTMAIAFGFFWSLFR